MRIMGNGVAKSAAAVMARFNGEGRKSSVGGGLVAERLRRRTEEVAVIKGPGVVTESAVKRKSEAGGKAGPAALECRGVHYCYAGKAVLENVSLAIAQSSVTSLVGPSGCGKSTLLKVLANLEEPESGEVLWWGKDSRIIGSPRRRLSMVFQEPALLPWRCVTANVALPLELAGLPKRNVREAAEVAIAMVGLSGKEGAFPRELSGGMQMRVSIARAMVTKPDILFMDEPFAALDEITRGKLNEEVLDISKKIGITIVFVTHSIPEAVFMSQEIVVLASNPGRIVEVVRLEKPEKFWDSDCGYGTSKEFFDSVRSVSLVLKAAMVKGAAAC